MVFLLVHGGLAIIFIKLMAWHFEQVGSVFEYFNKNPIFGVVPPDSPFWAPILGIFVFTGFPSAVSIIKPQTTSLRSFLLSWTSFIRFRNTSIGAPCSQSPEGMMVQTVAAHWVLVCAEEHCEKLLVWLQLWIHSTKIGALEWNPLAPWWCFLSFCNTKNLCDVSNRGVYIGEYDAVASGKTHMKILWTNVSWHVWCPGRILQWGFPL